MRFIQSFENATAIQTAVNEGNLGKPYVAYDKENQVVDWNSKEKPDYSKMYLTFEITEDGSITYNCENGYVTGNTIEYSVNGGEWLTTTAVPYNVIGNFATGDTIRFRGNNTHYGNGNSGICNQFTKSTAKFKVFGNIMSLIYGDDFIDKKELVAEYAFTYMFKSCSGLTDAGNLILPATTLARNCYGNMFAGCTSLTKAPTILPATTLANRCYYAMFYDCASLNYIKCLALNNPSAYTTYWTVGVSSTGTFVKAAGVEWPTGTSGIPEGWTVEEV